MARTNWDRIRRQAKLTRKRNNGYVAGRWRPRPRKASSGRGRSQRSFAPSPYQEAENQRIIEAYRRKCAEYEKAWPFLVEAGYSESWIGCQGMEWAIARAEELRSGDLLPKPEPPPRPTFDSSVLDDLTYGELVERLDDLVRRREHATESEEELEQEERAAINARLTELRSNRGGRAGSTA